ncbi:hypothetical protein HZA55_09895 [Candidatus Poribacteria bacterium]|nr:hypothetical protein [Candidatus Poribacteria bacterium]
MKKKALALLSGGLDSTLAIKVLLDQGIEVEAINFISPFCTCDRKEGCRHEAKCASEQLKIPLKIMATGKDYIEMIKKPRFGYGKNLNPCIDCRIFMLNKSKKYMEECGAGFLVTGEVLGQRPKSQRRDALNTIERESGLKGMILRPLSAKLLLPTIPEELGIVDRQKLLAIKGRSRKEQFELASKSNLKDFMCPGGGCLLTDKNFVIKLKDLFKHQEEDSQRNLILLRIGRHFRSSTGKKIIIGKNKDENNRLQGYISSDDAVFYLAHDLPSPIVLVPGGGDIAALNEAAGLCVYYSKQKGSCEVIYKHKDKSETIHNAALPEEQVEGLRIY